MHHVLSHKIEIPVFICQNIETKWETTSYFFGAKTVNTRQYVVFPPIYSECDRWSQTHEVNGVGELKVTAEDVWKTDIPVKPEYSWPHTINGIQRNVIIMKSKIYNNFYTNKLKELRIFRPPYFM